MAFWYIKYYCYKSVGIFEFSSQYIGLINCCISSLEKTLIKIDIQRYPALKNRNK